jgi:hypothetical protein
LAAAVPMRAADAASEHPFRRMQTGGPVPSSRRVPSWCHALSLTN